MAEPVHDERLKKIIFKPWTAVHIHMASVGELVNREWELTHLLHTIQVELALVQSYLKEKK